MISIVPPSGASTSTPRTETSRGLFGSNTVPSTQRSPASVRSLIESRLVKWRDRELRDSTMSMPRARAAARAFTIETPHARGGAGRDHIDAPALNEGAVVADAQFFDACRAHLRDESGQVIREANP